LRYITIDMGTTNTRIKYIEENVAMASYKEKIGVRDTAITGSPQKLEICIKNGIDECLKDCNRKISDVDKIIASGMITSNLGLVEIPHLETPIDMKGIKEHVMIKTFEEIVDRPMYFIPGVKNRIEDKSSEKFQSIDMMRGEETESIGALYLTKTEGDVVYISPGSHTKFVFFDDKHRIMKCSTTLTGELLWALANETILASSIPRSLISNIEEKYIMDGIETVKKYGFSKTCFLVRIMDIFTEATPNGRANFIAGAICYYDIKSIEEELKKKKFKILIGGTKALRELYSTIFKIMGYDMNRVITMDDELVEKACSIGAIRIVEGS